MTVYMHYIYHNVITKPTETCAMAVCLYIKQTVFEESSRYLRRDLNPELCLSSSPLDSEEVLCSLVVSGAHVERVVRVIILILVLVKLILCIIQETEHMLN